MTSYVGALADMIRCFLPWARISNQNLTSYKRHFWDNRGNLNIDRLSDDIPFVRCNHGDV